MAVNESLSAYSTTAANNTPAGSDTVGPDLDNHLRDIKKNIKTAVTNWFGETPENVAGSFMVDLSATPVGSINFQDGTDVIKMFDFDQSANTVTLPASNLGGGTAGKNVVDQESTASVRAAAGLGSFMGDEDSTASARTALGLGTAALENVGTSVSDVPELVSGSATSIAALPVVSGENLTNIPNTWAEGTTLVMDPWSSNVTLTQAHGLGVEPDHFETWLECLTADASWSSGERIYVGLVTQANANEETTFIVAADATETTLVTNSSSRPRILNKSTRATADITAASWKLEITPHAKIS